MYYPVGDIEICLNAFPNKDHKINSKPIIPVRLQKLANSGKIVTGKDSCAQKGSNRSHYQVWQGEAESQEQPEYK